MRPPRNTGGNNLRDYEHPDALGSASMRPPRNTGGNAALFSVLLMSTLRFNEAPAKHGGELARIFRE